MKYFFKPILYVLDFAILNPEFSNEVRVYNIINFYAHMSDQFPLIQF